MRRKAHFYFGGIMDEQLYLLIQLQEIDGKIRVLAERKKHLPDALAAIERKRAELKTDLEAVKEGVTAAQKSKRDRDKDLEDGVQKIAKLKARTSEIKTNKEYQALLKEIETAEKENKAIEDDILVLMEKVDGATAAIAAAEKRAREQEETLQSEKNAQESESVKIEETLKEVEAERQDAVTRIKPTILSQYQALLVSKGGIAMAEARGESCSGCYMSIPPQVFVNVKKNESVITCPHCGRILYYKEAIVQKS